MIKHFSIQPNEESLNTFLDSHQPEEIGYPRIDLIEESGESKLKYKTVPPPPHDYSKDYLTFEALEGGTFTMKVPSGIDSTYMTSISYSTDNGETWATTNIDNTVQTITTPTINQGDKVLWKGVGINMGNRSVSSCSYFTSTGNFNCYGNIMSLLYGDNFIGELNFPNNSTYTFHQLFNGTKVISAENIVLPAITLVSACYRAMFLNCQLLVSTPKLPATTLEWNCYEVMFGSCTSLVTAPELPATTLAGSCYWRMFSSCTALTSAPELPAITLVDSCYSEMFSHCRNLNYVKALFTTTPSTLYTDNWLYNVATTGTFVKNSAATWTTTSATGIPTGWTVETATE